MQYDRLADMYDDIMQDYSWCEGFLRSVIAERLQDPGYLLEVGCGTGRILELIAPLFKRSVGVDLTPEMLDHARERLPASEFYEQDMVYLDVPGKFDLIICLYDTMNHLMDFADWRRTIKKMGEHLSPDGLCLIDMNTPRRLARLSLFPPLVRDLEDGGVMIMRVREHGARPGAAEKFTFDTTIFQQNGDDGYTKHTVQIVEMTPPPEKMVEFLRECFLEVEIFDEDKRRVGSRLTLDEVGDGRLFFLCKGFSHSPEHCEKTSD